MNKTVLLTRPNHDNTTRYLFYWAQRIAIEAEAKGLQLLDLKEGRANRKEFESIIKSKEPSLILLYGHGGSDKVAGHNDEVLIEVGDNDNILKSKIIHALSCKSAKMLGPASVSSGALAYIGYDEDFVFCCIPEKTSKPLEDKLASLFLNPPELLIKNLLKGNSTGVSVSRAKNLFMDNIQKLLTAENSEYDYAVPYLLWNMNHLKLIGDNNASF
ncbi:MAG: hypothetical protein WC998_04975 [Candidatus Paceibacterota bacterium]|jgi:hypothetical protein